MKQLFKIKHKLIKIQRLNGYFQKKYSRNILNWKRKSFSKKFSIQFVMDNFKGIPCIDLCFTLLILNLTMLPHVILILKNFFL